MSKISKNKLISNLNHFNNNDPNHSAVLVLTEQPSSGIEFGVDCISYETGPKFRGLSAIPPGLHFIYYGTGMGARQGYFVRTLAGQLIVNAWDAANEQILPSHNLSPESLASLQLALSRGVLNAELGPYPFDQYTMWKRNTCYVTEEVLKGVGCSCGTLLYPGDESSIFNDDKHLSDAFKDKNYDNIQKSNVVVPGEVATTATFISIKQIEAQLMEQIPRSDPQNRSHLITQMMMNKSFLLQHLIDTHFSHTDSNLLGELQLSFMLFMLLYSYPALQHWKTLVYIICSSETYLREHPAFTSAFMKCFYYQLDFTPVDFFESELSKDNFLRPIIVSLFHSLENKNNSSGEDSASSRMDESSDDSEIDSVSNLEEIVNEDDEKLQTVDDHKKRLFKFLRRKFNLFESMSSILAVNPLSFRENEISSSSGRGGRLEEANIDSFSMMEEDQPTFVSQKELKDLEDYGRNRLTEVEKPKNMQELTTTGVFDMSNVGTNPCDKRWAANEEQLGYLRRAFGMDDSDYDANIVPMALMDINSNDSSSKKTDDVPNILKMSPMTAMEQEIAQFNWRYPLIFDNLQRSSVTGEYCEDFTMAAMRILEDAEDLDSGNNSKVVLEAMKFVEEEVSRMS